jgi:hypothetical protein
MILSTEKTFSTQLSIVAISKYAEIIMKNQLRYSKLMNTDP